MILARLAGMDAVGAVEALTATLNTFNKSGLDSTKVVNKLAKVDAAFAVSSQDLAQALQRVGASAKEQELVLTNYLQSSPLLNRKLPVVALLLVTVSKLFLLEFNVQKF